MEEMNREGVPAPYKKNNDDAADSEAYPPAWVDPYRDSDSPTDTRPVWTVFFQGMGPSQRELSRYTGQWGFRASTGEWQPGSFSAMEAIRYPFVGPEISEVVLGKLMVGRPSCVVHPFLWLGQSIADLTEDMYNFRAVPCGGCCLSAAPISQPTIRHHTLRMDRINVGQGGDVADHRRKWDCLQWHAQKTRLADVMRRNAGDKGKGKEKGKEKETDADTNTETPTMWFSTPDGNRRLGLIADPEVYLRRPPLDHIADIVDNDHDADLARTMCGDPTTVAGLVEPEPCILFGTARGAAATLNAIAANKYDAVKLVVLEGCFDTVRSVLEAQVGRNLLPFWEFLLHTFTRYEAGSSLCPIKMAAQFPTTVPVGFVTSMADEEVPPRITRRVVGAIRAAGHEQVHLLVLRRSGHGRYTTDDARDCRAYTYWLHALYHRYRLPYVPQYATEGEPLLDETEGGGQDRWFQNDGDVSADTK